MKSTTGNLYIEVLQGEDGLIDGYGNDLPFIDTLAENLFGGSDSFSGVCELRIEFKSTAWIERATREYPGDQGEEREIIHVELLAPAVFTAKKRREVIVLPESLHDQVLALYQDHINDEDVFYDEEY